jgi:hypothetical protein
VAELARNYIPLTKVAAALPETYERVRQLVHDGRIPFERDANGRIFAERGFSLRLLEARPNHPSISTALKHIKHGSLR